VTRTINRERYRPTDHRLGRHVNHDSESRRYRVDTTGLRIASVQHRRHIGVLNQGDLGSCTGNAGIGCLGTDPNYDTLPTIGGYALTQQGAVALYSAATRIDEYPGEYPPEDTGSDGLSIAKALRAAGDISGYRWAFSLDDALKALTASPLITGIPWYSSMFTPGSDGLVKVFGALAGGHEIVVDEYDGARGWVGFTNSWGSDWGLAGRFYLAVEDWGTLLAQQGDVTAFVPATAPAPVPDPPGPALDPADVAFATALRPWATQRHAGGNARAAIAAQAWLRAKNL
jgi:hypothetical protein